LNKINLTSNIFQQLAPQRNKESTSQHDMNDSIEDSKNKAQQANNTIKGQRVRHDFSLYYESQEEISKKNEIKFLA